MNIKTQITEGSSGRGLAVLDVHSPTDIVWSRILDYDNYPKMVNGCTSSKNYKVIQHKPSKSNQYLSQTIFTRMKIGMSFVQLEYFIEHSYHPKLGVLTWTLDYSKQSDLDDSVGYWYVVEHPSKGAEWSRVFYSVDVALPGWVPKFARDFFSTKALTDATGWVKRESEKVYEKQGGGASTAMTVDDTKKKKQKKWRNPFRKQNSVGIDSNTREAQSCKSIEMGGGESSSCADASSTSKQDAKTTTSSIYSKPRAKRAFMIFLIFVLLLYNIGLFLERMSTN